MQPYFRDAVRGDLAAIATIMRDEAPHDAAQARAKPSTYERALEEIDRHEGSYLLVAEYGNRLGAVAHLVTFPIMHGGGGRHAEIVGEHESDVHVDQCCSVHQIVCGRFDNTNMMPCHAGHSPGRS